MFILIPVNRQDAENAEIAPQAESAGWALIDFDAGEAKNITFHENWEESGEEWIDFVILANKYENYLDFMNLGMMVLTVRDEKRLDDIINAFKFKELDEIGL